MDSRDARIVNILKEDSRKSIRDIAKVTGIRPSTVHQRIQKLIKEKIIKNFTIKLNYRLLNQNFVAFILINTRGELPLSFFSNPKIKDVFGVTGEFDLLLKLRFKDVDEFNDFLITLRKNPKIIKSLTLVSTIELKEEG
ncbi:Lrp/AsnC family transcriptional regulator [Candidatus Woesearchaeota archaeon]|nr:Lrp/AsnC family transcriptional regulator [Candidatus Woesearchaeota archaeon]